ncbi:hypothetical protein [Clostridium argentinense]|nr:hypothetical protein [Clostridium argentinense]ARC85424.1 hypothetical protein RSJ17_13390 [Clostridium argentinense]
MYRYNEIEINDVCDIIHEKLASYDCTDAIINVIAIQLCNDVIKIAKVSGFFTLLNYNTPNPENCNP